MKNSLTLELKKVGRKWFVEGDGEGWIFNRSFPAKWKAKCAIKVFKRGGKVSDYWKATRDSRKERIPYKVLEYMKEALEEIKKLNPTPSEIEEYAEGAGYGTVTYTDKMGYFPPRLHDTWGIKRGGRVHIDIGSGGYHLMLDKDIVQGFIDSIKENRGIKND